MSIRSRLRPRLEWLPAVFVVGLLANMACEVQYARAWESRLTLALHEAQIAPRKPRVLNELALALMERGRVEEAQVVLNALALEMDDPKRPVWDRREARQAWIANSALLARMTDARRMPTR